MVCLKVGFPVVPSLRFSVKSSHCRLSNMALTLLSSVLISVSLESTCSGSLASQTQCIKIDFKWATCILLTTKTTDIIWFITLFFGYHYQYQIIHFVNRFLNYCFGYCWGGSNLYSVLFRCKIPMEVTDISLWSVIILKTRPWVELAFINIYWILHCGQGIWRWIRHRHCPWGTPGPAGWMQCACGWL